MSAFPTPRVDPEPPISQRTANIARALEYAMRIESEHRELRAALAVAYETPAIRRLLSRIRAI